MLLMPVNAVSIAEAEPVAHGAVPHRIECCCTFKNRLLYVASDLCLNSTSTLSSANLALEDIGALAAEYGRLAVWAHSPPFSGLGAASTAAGRCISAGAPSQPLARFRF